MMSKYAKREKVKLCLCHLNIANRTMRNVLQFFVQNSNFVSTFLVTRKALSPLVAGIHPHGRGRARTSSSGKKARPFYIGK